MKIPHLFGTFGARALSNIALLQSLQSQIPTFQWVCAWSESAAYQPFHPLKQTITLNPNPPPLPSSHQERPFPKHHSEMPTFPSSHHQPSAPTQSQQQQQQQQPGAASAPSSHSLFGQHHQQHGRPNRDNDLNRQSHALHGAMPKWR